MSKVTLGDRADVPVSETSISETSGPLQLSLTPSPEEDSIARFLAYTSPYLFWGTISVLSVGILLVR